jgi:hypothetical protein
MRFIIMYSIIMCLGVALTMAVADSASQLINTLMQQAIDLFP